MKPEIICIVGESGSGKSLLAEMIEKTFNGHFIQSYTDRPRRTHNETGHTFVTSSEFDSFKLEDMIAFTKFGDYRYCCLKKDVHPSKLNIYVIDEKGILYLKENFRDIYDIKSIRVKRDIKFRVKEIDMDRIMRDKNNFNLPDEYYDFTIHNNHSESYLLSCGVSAVREAFNK